ncbi:MAG: hypothetical protein WD136_09025 [Cyanobium sp.]
MLAALPGANTSARLHPSRIAGGLIGAVLAFLLTWQLPLVPSTLLSSIGLAVGASLSGRPWRPIYWWGVLGAVTGGLLGTATVLAARLQELDPRADWPTRALVVLLLALAGAVSGRLLSGDASRSDRHHPRDVLRSLSALTTGIFAVLVTLAFVHSGLDVARAFSSRLSSSLTILVASVTVPGWLVHLLFHQTHLLRAQTMPSSKDA